MSDDVPLCGKTSPRMHGPCVKPKGHKSACESNWVGGEKPSEPKLDDQNMSDWPVENVLAAYDEMTRAIFGDWGSTGGFDITKHSGRVACAKSIANWRDNTASQEVATWRDRYEQLQWVIQNLGRRSTIDKERIAAVGWGNVQETHDETLALEAVCHHEHEWTRAKMIDFASYGLFEEPSIYYRQMEGSRLIYAISANRPRATVRVQRGNGTPRSVGGPALVLGDALLSPLVVPAHLDFTVDVMSDEPNWRVYVKLHTLRSRSRR